jgi:hypothetical protein
VLGCRESGVLYRALAVAVAPGLGVAVGAAGGPALMVRIMGAPGSVWVPAVGCVRMAVCGALGLASVLISATSKPALEMLLTATSRLWLETSGTSVSLTSPESLEAATASVTPGGSSAIADSLGTRGSALLA